VTNDTSDIKFRLQRLLQRKRFRR